MRALATAAGSTSHSNESAATATWIDEDARAFYEEGAIYSGRKPHARWCDDLKVALTTIEAFYRGDRRGGGDGNGNDVRDDLVRQLGDAMLELLDGGFTLPIHMACVAVNGVIVFAPDTAPEDASRDSYELLVAHDLARGLQRPIDVVLVDAAGDAARVVIPLDEDYQIIHQERGA